MPHQSTLRSSAITPTPTPSPLSHPDLLLRILSQADNPTLATCLRVSKAWYDLAGPILYHHHIRCPDLQAVQKLLRGTEIQSRTIATRNTPRRTNLKTSLLRNIRSLDIGVHAELQNPGVLYRLPNLFEQLTLWFDFLCDGGVVDSYGNWHSPDIIDIAEELRETQDDAEELWETQVTTITKVVLRGIHSFCSPHQAEFIACIPWSKTMSVVLRPWSLSDLEAVFIELQEQDSIEPAPVRRVFLDSGLRKLYHHLSLKTSEECAREWSRWVVDCRAFYSVTEVVDIYFMTDIRVEDEEETVLSPSDCKSLVEAAIQAYPRNRVNVDLDMIKLKTRADYLAETVKDEYGEEDLEFFRQAERKAEEREREKEGDGAEGTKTETATTDKWNWADDTYKI